MSWVECLAIVFAGLVVWVGMEWWRALRLARDRERCFDPRVRAGQLDCWSLCRRDSQPPCRTGEWVRF